MSMFIIILVSSDLVVYIVNKLKNKNKNLSNSSLDYTG